jgi:hypothetical protein
MKFTRQSPLPCPLSPAATTACTSARGILAPRAQHTGQAHRHRFPLRALDLARTLLSHTTSGSTPTLILGACPIPPGRARPQPATEPRPAPRRISARPLLASGVHLRGLPGSAGVASPRVRVSRCAAQRIDVTSMRNWYHARPRSPAERSGHSRGRCLCRSAWRFDVSACHPPATILPLRKQGTNVNECSCPRFGGFPACFVAYCAGFARRRRAPPGTGERRGNTLFSRDCWIPCVPHRCSIGASGKLPAALPTGLALGCCSGGFAEPASERPGCSDRPSPSCRPTRAREIR